MASRAEVCGAVGPEAAVRRQAELSRLLPLIRTESTAVPALLRVVLALVVWPHGAQHLVGWFGGYGYAGTHAWMTGDLGIPATLATLAILTEFFAPIALLLGAGGRVAALGIAGLMTIAAGTHAANGFFMNWFGTLPAGAEGFEYHVLATALALAIVLQGSGAWSLDHVIADRLAGGPARRTAGGAGTHGGRARGVQLTSIAAALMLLSACSDADPTAPGGERLPVALVVVSPDTLTLEPEQTRQLSARTYATDGRELHGRQIVWQSSNDSVAEITADGRVRALREGTVTLRASSESRAGEARVRVVGAPAPVARVTITPPGPVVLAPGATVRLEAVVQAANDSILSDRQIAWSSEHADIAVVSEAGVVEARAEGTTTITAAVGSIMDEVTITVEVPQQAVARIELTGELQASLMIGTTRQLGARLFAADGGELFDRTVRWSSLNHAIVSVSETGLITGHYIGGTLITASAEGMEAHVAVDVRSPVARVVVTADASAIVTGEVVRVTAVAQDEAGATVQRPIEWSSSNPAVAEVDAQGNVTGHTGGTARIIATVDGQQGWVDVTVAAWVSRSLATVDDQSLPIELWRTNDGGGETVVTTSSGSFRLAQTGINSGRYQMDFAVTILSPSNVPQHGIYGFAGTYAYDLASGKLVLTSYSGERLEAVLLPGGGVRVTGRLHAGTAIRVYGYGPVE